MRKKIKLFLLISLVLISTLFIMYFFLNYYHNKQIIKNVSSSFSKDTFVSRVQNINTTSDLSINIDGSTIVGVIKIEKINFEGIVYEGTSQDILEKGVGHFESSPITKGNICLAAHNTANFWKNLHTLQKNDIITYTNILGTKDYKVFNSEQIEETDLSCLENTQSNILTLITCVKNVPNKRLCVQAIEL